MSMRNGRLWKPRLTKDTASTITIASISTLMNSSTERATARGWSATFSISMPIGSAARTALSSSAR